METGSAGFGAGGVESEILAASWASTMGGTIVAGIATLYRWVTGSFDWGFGADRILGLNHEWNYSCRNEYR